MLTKNHICKNPCFIFCDLHWRSCEAEKFHVYIYIYVYVNYIKNKRILYVM
jgi:hypothetical protein